MKLEDRQYEGWKAWAIGEVRALRQLQGSAYTGQEAEDGGEGQGRDATGSGVGREEVQTVSDSVPASRKGQLARGGVAVHP